MYPEGILVADGFALVAFVQYFTYYISAWREAIKARTAEEALNFEDSYRQPSQFLLQSWTNCAIRATTQWRKPCKKSKLML